MGSVLSSSPSLFHLFTGLRGGWGEEVALWFLLLSCTGVAYNMCVCAVCLNECCILTLCPLGRSLSFKFNLKNMWPLFL